MTGQPPAPRDALGDYLNLRRALGFRLANAGRLLGQFVSYLEARGADTVTAEHALAWATQPAGASVHWQAIRLSVVRGFAAYLHSLDPAAEIIPAGQFRAGPCRATPYLYSDAEIGSLIKAAAALRPGLRAATYQTLIGLLAVSGIRVGEAIGLDEADFDAWYHCTPARCRHWHAMCSSGGRRILSRPARHCSSPPPGPGCCTATSA
jgi:integrase